MKKALLILGGLFFIVIGAALVVPSFVDWNQYKDQVRSAVHSLTSISMVRSLDRHDLTGLLLLGSHERKQQPGKDNP